MQSRKLYKIFYNNPLLLYFLILFSILSFFNFVYFKSFTVGIKYSNLFPELKGDKKLKFQKKVVKKLKHIKDLNLHIYIVKLGDNYWEIAKNNGIDIDTIVGFNPYLKNLLAALNEHLLVGNKKGVIHIVRKGETIKSISQLYNISIHKIYKANKISFLKRLFFTIKEGEVLFIPDAKPKILTKDMKHWYDLRDDLQSPLGGHYTSGFGMRINPVTKKRMFHNGLDIGVRMGTPVGAANDGIVIYAGWAGGYGKMIKIKHFNGYTTLYGHLSRIYVRVGQKVKKGQIIARSGNTGRTTGPHLHFTVWYHGKPVNPVWFLW